MAGKKNEKAIEAEKLFRKGLKLIEIARKLELPEGTVRRWKSTYKWDSERSESKANVRKKPGAPKGNKNATGPPGNKHAQKHGLFSKYLPSAVFDIVEEIEHKPPIDILWENITLTYANLLHAQRILFVETNVDHDRFTAGDFENGTTYEYHTAWDKQSRAFQAFARTQSELRQMIKMYDELTRSDLVTEEQKLRIEAIRMKVQPSDTAEDRVQALLEQVKGAYRNDT